MIFAFIATLICLILLVLVVLAIVVINVVINLKKEEARLAKMQMMDAIMKLDLIDEYYIFWDYRLE